MSSTLWGWGRACCCSCEKLIVFSCVICFGEKKNKKISQFARGHESLVNALMSPLEQCIVVVLIPKARGCISSMNLPNDSWYHDAREEVKKLSVSPAILVASVLLQPDFKGRGNAGSWMWWRRQQRKQLDARSLAWEDKGGSEDWQEVRDLKCYWKPAGKRRLIPEKELEGRGDTVRLWDGESICEKGKKLRLLMGQGVSGW